MHRWTRWRFSILISPGCSGQEQSSEASIPDHRWRCGAGSGLAAAPGEREPITARFVTSVPRWIPRSWPSRHWWWIAAACWPISQTLLGHVAGGLTTVSSPVVTSLPLLGTVMEASGSNRLMLFLALPQPGSPAFPRRTYCWAKPMPVVAAHNFYRQFGVVASRRTNSCAGCWIHRSASPSTMCWPLNKGGHADMHRTRCGPAPGRCAQR